MTASEQLNGSERAARLETDPSDLAEAVALLSCHDTRGALACLHESLTRRGNIRQAVLFSHEPWENRLVAEASLGLSENEERMYRSLALDLPNPVVECHWSQTRQQGRLMDLAARYPEWALYLDEVFCESEFDEGHVIVQPLTRHEVSVGAVFVLVASAKGLDQIAAHVEQSATALAAFIAGMGYCRMVSPSLARDHTNSQLSLRDRMILLLAEDGLQNAQIAKSLSEKLGKPISESTVRNDLTRVFRHLGASNRRDAARKARARGDLAGLR